MLTRSRIYSPLRFIVECRWPQKGYEVIAAFDSFDIAHQYVQDCFEANKRKGFEYQLIERAKIGATLKVRASFTHAV